MKLKFWNKNTAPVYEQLVNPKPRLGLTRVLTLRQAQSDSLSIRLPAREAALKEAITKAQRDDLFKKNKSLFDVETMQKKLFEFI